MNQARQLDITIQARHVRIKHAIALEHAQSAQTPHNTQKQMDKQVFALLRTTSHLDAYYTPHAESIVSVLREDPAYCWSKAGFENGCVKNAHILTSEDLKRT